MAILTIHTLSIQVVKLNDLQDLCKDTGRCFNGEDDRAVALTNDVRCFTGRRLRDIFHLHCRIVEFLDDLSMGKSQYIIIQVYLGFIILIMILRINHVS